MTDCWPWLSLIVFKCLISIGSLAQLGLKETVIMEKFNPELGSAKSMKTGRNRGQITNRARLWSQLTVWHQCYCFMHSFSVCRCNYERKKLWQRLLGRFFFSVFNGWTASPLQYAVSGSSFKGIHHLNIQNILSEVGFKKLCQGLQKNFVLNND